MRVYHPVNLKSLHRDSKSMADQEKNLANNAQGKFEGASLELLIAVIDGRVNEIIGRCNTIECVARGGESWAKSLDRDGDPMDSVSGGMFRSIINQMEDSEAENGLRDAVRELRRITAQPPTAA